MELIISAFVFTGLPVILHDENDIQIFEYGFARLVSVGDYLYPKSAVVIDEQLAVLAELSFFKQQFQNQSLDFMTHLSYLPSTLGFLWVSTILFSEIFYW